MHEPAENHVADPPAAKQYGHAPAARSGSPARGQKRQRLVAGLRGYFLAPVIASLGECGIAERMLQGPFSITDFAPLADTRTLSILFRYLQSVGLLVCEGDSRYALTEDGFTSLSRNGAYSLLVSYADYFDKLPELLAGAPVTPTVNRARNVRGSGHLHGRKFFPAALDCLQSNPPSALIDIGCGDGAFLECACARWPAIVPFGLDLSETAVDIARCRLARQTGREPLFVLANGREVPSWSTSVPPALGDSDGLVISMWFVAHEFSASSTELMVRHFNHLHQCFPNARILLGEINKIAPADLAHNRDLSIMPEYLLFHELSGQGVLAWTDWQHILEHIPYRLEKECRFDDVQSASGASIPASFVWLLRPSPQPASN
jgi:2-ketoarginine methyltransferase